MSVLVLGGTAEARELAVALDADKVEFVSSLAGRVSRPRLPVGEVRFGGFGGIDGLTEFLRDTRVTSVVDATHPFAAGISAHAWAACRATGVPLLRLARPGWGDEPGADRWHWVGGHDEAAATAAGLAGKVLLTIGRQRLGRYVDPLASGPVLARVVDPVQETLPESWRVILDRGPYCVDAELSLMKQHDIDVLVTKDSGGDYTRAKLDAAHELGVDVVVVRRPEGTKTRWTVSDVAGAVRWLRARRG